MGANASFDGSISTRITTVIFLLGIEACASSHHWSRELKALGHTVRLMPPAYVKPYVKRQKNDTADAEAFAVAVISPKSNTQPSSYAS